MSINKTISLFISLGMMLAILLVGVSRVSAFNPFDGACKVTPASGTSKSSVCSTDGKDPITGKDQEGILVKATKLLTLAVGIIAVIAIIFGGFQYSLSAGDPNKTSQSKNTIIYAVVGLVVAAVARGIVVFVINKL